MPMYCTAVAKYVREFSKNEKGIEIIALHLRKVSINEC